MHDAHVHLDFMSNGEQVAARARRRGMGLLAATVTPTGYSRALGRFGEFDNVRIGWGMHPWWVEADASLGERQMRDASASVNFAVPNDARFIGEVGLDFGKRRLETRDEQLRAFTHIACSCAEQGSKLLSIHTVHAAKETLDVLESCGTLETCTCVFHWFTGPSDQLKRAIDMGCYFSAGPRMTATRKGHEYVKAIPAKRLLLETDAPPAENTNYPFEELCRELGEAAEAITAIKGPDALAVMDDTFARLFASLD